MFLTRRFRGFGTLLKRATKKLFLKAYDKKKWVLHVFSFVNIKSQRDELIGSNGIKRVLALLDMSTDKMPFLA